MRPIWIVICNSVYQRQTTNVKRNRVYYPNWLIDSCRFQMSLKKSFMYYKVLQILYSRLFAIHCASHARLIRCVILLTFMDNWYVVTVVDHSHNSSLITTSRHWLIYCAPCCSQNIKRKNSFDWSGYILGHRTHAKRKRKKNTAEVGMQTIHVDA